jgi:hypothetical protein
MGTEVTVQQTERVMQGRNRRRVLVGGLVASLALIVAVTLLTRAVEGIWLGRPHLRWLVDGEAWRDSLDIDASWLLNVVLFVPAGWFLGLLWRRPLATVAVLVASSLTVELLQSAGGLGATDPGDLLANSLGAALGAGGAWLMLRRAHPDRRGHRDHVTAEPWTSADTAVTGAVAVVVAIIAVIAVFVTADTFRSQLDADVHRNFEGTTAGDIAARADTDEGYLQLLRAVSPWPDYFGEVGTTGEWAARYHFEFIGLQRCVFVRWDDAGLTTRQGRGTECTEFHERPPTDAATP